MDEVQHRRNVGRRKERKEGLWRNGRAGRMTGERNGRKNGRRM